MAAVRTLDAEARGALAELLNLGGVRAAEILGELIGASLEIRVSAVNISSAAGFPDPPAPQIVITQAFAGSVRGRTSLCFATSDGIALAMLLSGRSPVDNAELDFELCGVLLEVGNVVLNGVLGSLSCALPPDLRYALPELHNSSGRGQPWITESMRDGDVLLGEVRFRVAQQEIDGTIALACPLGGIHGLLDSLLEPIAAS